MGASIYSVKQVNTYIKQMFKQDMLLNNIHVKGEISNCKYHSSGHIYFSLKDESGAIACVMFAGHRKGLAFNMKDGDKVVVAGSVDVYERDGRYQVYAKEITLEGAGILYERYLRLKNELEEMGMFANEYKQSIPHYIKKLGVVTAQTGAVLQDIANVARRRNPYMQIILYSAQVQGEGAAPSIVCGIEALDRYGVDIIVVGRGGGSIEDLWAFNEEIVARAIFDCKTPIISAVGHETDFTIADFVADLRAPTPSAAAELATYDYMGMQNQFLDIKRRLQSKLLERIQNYRYRMEYLKSKLGFLSPENKIREKRQYLVDTEERLNNLIQQKFLRTRHQLEIYIERLKGLSPLSKLNKGFAYATDSEDRALKSITQVKKEDQLLIHLKDGKVRAIAKELIGEKEVDA